MEPYKNHIEQENHLPKLQFLGFKMLIFQGVNQIVKLQTSASDTDIYILGEGRSLMCQTS